MACLAIRRPPPSSEFGLIQRSGCAASDVDVLIIGHARPDRSEDAISMAATRRRGDRSGPGVHDAADVRFMNEIHAFHSQM
jgi:hypothetical protein